MTDVRRTDYLKHIHTAADDIRRQMGGLDGEAASQLFQGCRREGGRAMTDTLTPTQRSLRMGRIKGSGTKPEWTIRRLLHSMGYRYRLHRRDLPGTPDIVFPGRRKVVFVHGCFWHRHDDPGCRLARLPKGRLDFWLPKLEGNRQRDERNRNMLIADGWGVLEIWECELSDMAGVRSKLVAFLEADT